MFRVLLPISGAVVGILPVALSGALILSIRPDLELSLTHFGLLVAFFFIMTAVGAKAFGGSIDRFGAFNGFRIAALLSGISFITFAVSDSAIGMAAALAVGGLSNGIANPAANRFISMAIDPRHQGAAFGAKQASIPLAGVIAGLSVVVVDQGLPWRLMFLFFTIAAVVVLVATHFKPHITRDSPSYLPPPSATPPLSMPLVALGAALGAAATSPLGIFLVDAAVYTGLEPAGAGWLLALASFSSVTTRVLLGWGTDLRPPINPFALVGKMLIASFAGFIALASGWIPFFVFGALVTYLVGWSWNGIFHHGVVTHNTGRPGRASGTVQAALAIGAAAGPLLFGALVNDTSYSVSWLTMGFLAMTSGVILLLSRKNRYS